MKNLKLNKISDNLKMCVQDTIYSYKDKKYNNSYIIRKVKNDFNIKLTKSEINSLFKEKEFNNFENMLNKNMYYY